MRRMHADGASCNEVARALGRAPSTISRVSARLGLTWDRAAQTAAATAAAQADARTRRLGIIARLYGQIETILDRLEAPVYSWTTTTGNGIETAQLDQPPAQEVKALIQSVSSAATTAAKLEAVDSDHGADGAKSMIAGLAEGLRAVAAHLGNDDEHQAAEDESG
ncbi:helix-turn-helix domain-containing protein [Nonomuraea sp. K274]|uniref:Helix-turn-helix domain-containing protein n=1 Tax=Nonomuraea cypriaca TaxID=1187855 RepID=A0A931EXK3_9ACTN|nr:helix-turn-helix domain-containing protein [Nonomuraea cypriaca]